MRRVFVSVLSTLAVALLPATSTATTITFNSDPIGAKANGFVSADSPLVSFTDSVGSGLNVINSFETAGTNGLAVFTDFDDSELIMNFTGIYDFLSLDFGNDDPGFSNPGDTAVLTLFLGLVQVAQTTVVMNRNDLMDQNIALSGFLFDRATFKYNVPANQGLIEVVDNITFQQAVPEPGTLALLGIGLAAAGRRLRRRQ